MICLPSIIFTLGESWSVEDIRIFAFVIKVSYFLLNILKKVDALIRWHCAVKADIYST